MAVEQGGYTGHCTVGQYVYFLRARLVAQELKVTEAKLSRMASLQYFQGQEVSC